MYHPRQPIHAHHSLEPAISLDVNTMQAHPMKSKSLATSEILDTDTHICGRSITIPHDTTRRQSSFNASASSSSQQRNRIVLIGYDNMNHVQTNNHINAIFHAMDYAIDVNATLGIVEEGWAMKALVRMFRHNEKELSYEIWKENLADALHLFIVKDFEVIEGIDEIGLSRIDLPHAVVEMKSGDEMYFYNTNATSFNIRRRREEVLKSLWTHPTRSSKKMRDMCSGADYHHLNMHGYSHSHHHASLSTISSSSSSSSMKYAVIHSRWMKDGKCLKRMKRLSRHVRHQTGIRLDEKAACLLEPSYIEHILKKFHSDERSRMSVVTNTKETDMDRERFLDFPIYVISDGLNPDIITNLQQYPPFGRNIHIVPHNVSWVGSDMMLGVLADVFIGTPISTLSGNIARARTALGFHPNTNFLFPLERSCDTSKHQQKLELEQACDWEFTCQDDTGGAECLYDKRMLQHYVG